MSLLETNAKCKFSTFQMPAFLPLVLQIQIQTKIRQYARISGRRMGIGKENEEKQAVEKAKKTAVVEGLPESTHGHVEHPTRSMTQERFDYCRALNYDVLGVTELWRT